MSEPHVDLQDPPVTAPNGRALGTKGERTRRRLLEAAEEVFGAVGFHDASIVKLTEAAGVSQGTYYNYFPSKLAIFEELVADLNRRVRHAMSEASSRGTTRAEAERLGFRAFFRFTAEHPALYRVIRQAEFVSPRALHQHYERIAEGYVAGLQAAMATGEIGPGNPDTLAWLLMGVGEIVGMRWILWSDADAVPDHVLDEVYAFILRGLGAEEATR